MKLTAWYPGNIQPVHEGWYERKYNGGTRMDYFVIGAWWSTDDPESHRCINQYLQWRGIVK